MMVWLGGGLVGGRTCAVPFRVMAGPLGWMGPVYCRGTKMALVRVVGVRAEAGRGSGAGAATGEVSTCGGSAGGSGDRRGVERTSLQLLRGGRRMMWVRWNFIFATLVRRRFEPGWKSVLGF